MVRRMKKTTLQKAVESIVITSPCSVGWDNMTGDDKIRFCGQCKKNVHNLSTLPPREVTEVLSKLKKNERVCVLMYRRADGSVIMDNCPVVLRKTRDRIRAVYVAVLLALFWLLGTNADAQGLVGAPVDPRYGTSGQMNEIGVIPEVQENDFLSYLAFLTGLGAITFPFLLPKATPLRTKTWHHIALFVIPLVVLAIGTYIWNNQDLLSLGGVR